MPRVVPSSDLAAASQAAVIRVALVVRDPGLRALVAAALGASRYALVDLADQQLDRCLLEARQADVCLVDPGGCGDGLGFLKRFREGFEAPPVVFVAEHDDAALDLRAMSHGAANFLVRAGLDGRGLERAVRYAYGQRAEAARLARLAQYDGLTGLANRRLFDERLGRALARARRSGRRVAVMVLDLNGFKAVNDGLGHPSGDRLLKIVAARLTARLRETDTIARFGGDEFALVIENLARPEYATLVARKIMDAIAPPVLLDDRQVAVTASLGVAVSPDDGETADVLLAGADQAMYRAKADGGHGCRFCRAERGGPVQAAGILDGELCEALTSDALTLEFRPQIPIADRAVVVAAVPRWRHPALGIIEPARFLPLAEDAGLLGRLTDWILDHGCMQLRAWQTAGLGEVRLALPLVSRRQLAWDDLPKRLERGLGGLDPTALELEVPEDLVLGDLEAGESGLRQLRAVGVRIALAGYGAAPVPLAPVCAGLIDTLKIGLQSLPDLPAAGREALLAALLGSARATGIRTVALGASDDALDGFLRHHQCGAFEGLAYLGASEASLWLANARARLAGVPDRPVSEARIAAAG